jgi:hypothetical protein
MDFPATPDLQFVMRVHATIGEPVVTGDTARGKRVAIPITGGTVEGPFFAGEVIPMGADFQVVWPSGITEIHAEYVVKTDSGVLIHVDNGGLTSPATLATPEQFQGDGWVDDGVRHFRTAARLTTEGANLAWMNANMFVCSGRGQADKKSVVIDFYRIG